MRGTETEAGQVADLPEDCRLQLFNEGRRGVVTEIQLPLNMITSLRGVMLDLDPDLFLAGHHLPVVSDRPEEFYQQVVQPWLGRHPTLAKAEVRMTGRGLHALLWLDCPIAFATDAERQQWAQTVQIVQASLPVDPDQPGMTATTREIGAINGKNGQRVRQLAAGEKVSAQELLALAQQMCDRPFSTLSEILFGSTQLQPCPFCREATSRLAAMEHIGMCYGHCGRIKVDRLYDLFLKPRDSK